MTLVEFIEARYDDIEQVARAASPGPWSPDADGTEVLAEDGVTVAEGFALSGPQLRATVEHITLNDPAYVLADIAAKREILKLHNFDFPYNPDDGPGDYAWTPRCDECHTEWPCPTLRQLAAPFASHPDYDEAWRPS